MLCFGGGPAQGQPLFMRRGVPMGHDSSVARFHWHAIYGHPEEEGRLLAEVQTALETSAERWYEAEVHRRRCELLWRYARAEASQAETCFLQDTSRWSVVSWPNP